MVLDDLIRLQSAGTRRTCGQACPCCGKYKLVGTPQKWTCEFCKQEGTLAELRVIREGQVHPGDFVWDGYFQELSKEDNALIKQAREMGFCTFWPVGENQAINTLAGAMRYLGEE